MIAILYSHQEEALRVLNYWLKTHSLPFDISRSSDFGRITSIYEALPANAPLDLVAALALKKASLDPDGVRDE